MTNDNTIAGLIGTALSAVGMAISASDIQAIISTIVTVLGFILGVVIPWILKLVSKIKEAKKDGHISSEETDDLISSFEEAAKDISEKLPKDK